MAINLMGRVTKQTHNPPSSHPSRDPTHLRHAHSGGLALELLVAAVVGRARGAALLVGGVVAVRDAVALVALVDALLEVVALELRGGARDGGTVGLVGVVEAVVVAVADPRLRDAVARGLAGELEVGASLLGAKVALVARVPAVVLAVALPRHRYAPAIKMRK